MTNKCKVLLTKINENRNDLDKNFMIDNIGCSFSILELDYTKEKPVKIELQGANGYVWCYLDELTPINLSQVYWSDYLF